MFNNIIYFILVILIFNISYPDTSSESSLIFSFTVLFLTWLGLVLVSRFGFQRLAKRLGEGLQTEGHVTIQYHRFVTRCSVLSVFLFAINVYLFNLKYWIQAIPGFRVFSVLQGLTALAVFFLYLGTIWYVGYPVYRSIFQTEVSRLSFVKSNMKLNLPIIFPWIALTSFFDLIVLSPWPRLVEFLARGGGQILFMVCFLCIVMIFMPRFIQYWWECKPVDNSEKANHMKAFLLEQGFRYRGLLRWPLFEGRMLTAGIMGIIPRYRYLLITDSLIETLSIEELKAVLAHEMGHAKHRHFLFYLLFFVGLIVLFIGLFDVFNFIVAGQPFFKGLERGDNPHAIVVLAIPLLLSVFIYFRYVMGFFMRHFERQADLYSAVIMGTPRHTISSLEKIAFLSGKSRDLPSWHHFSIRERVEYLWRTLTDGGLLKRHNRLVRKSVLIYLVCLVSVGYSLNFSPLNKIFRKPQTMELYQNLAMAYHQLGKNREAKETYERILQLDPNQAVSLNNLAWILVTSPDEELRDNARGLQLAKRAVDIDRSPIFLDTLAEAYFVNGFVDEAIEAIEEAISKATETRTYYEQQLRKFSTAGH